MVKGISDLNSVRIRKTKIKYEIKSSKNLIVLT